MVKFGKFFAALVLLATLGVTALFGACAAGQSTEDSLDEPTKLEHGFGVSSGCAPMPSEHCAYRSDAIISDIDNVKVTFYFGRTYSSDDWDLERERNYNSIPEFDVYFADKNHELLYLIRHSDENFISEEYRVTIEKDVKRNVKVFVFNHSEEITIPRELFTDTQGVLRFYVSGVNIKSKSPEYETITCAYLNYDFVGENQVKLSRWDGYRK